MGIKPRAPLDTMFETDPFNKRRINEQGKVSYHAGQDLRADIGTDVKAILDGEVVRSFHRKLETVSYGKMIIIYHGENAKTDKHTYSLYAHLNRRIAKVGETVSQKQVIAKSGDTGNVVKHLHFEVMETSDKIKWGKTGREMGNYIYGVPSVDPMAFLKKPFLKNIEPLTEAESEIVHSMVEVDFKGNPNPTFFVKAPPFREIMKRIRPGTDITAIEPPIFNLIFENAFSNRFKKQYPSIALNVNGKTIDRIRPGTTNYDLSIWS